MTEFILCSVIVLAIATLYISTYIRSKLIFDKMSDSFLLFAVFHSLYALVGFVFFQNFSFNDVAVTFLLAYGPFFYFGVKSLINNKVKRKSLYIHFFPVALFCLSYILCTEFFREYLIGLRFVLCFSVSLSMLVYASLVFFIDKSVYHLRVQVRKMVVSAAILLNVLALSFAGIMINQVFFKKHTDLKNAEAILYIGILIFIFILFRYKILMLRHYLKRQLVNNNNITVDVRPDKNNIKVNETLSDKTALSGKYTKSALNVNIFQDYERKLNKFFDEDKIYLENDITLEDLAGKMKLSKHHLTQLFNVYLGENFNQYINKYRIDYSCHLLKSNNEDLTIEEIAFESGFNSKVSFNRHFKNLIGCTPSDYLKTPHSASVAK